MSFFEKLKRNRAEKKAGGLGLPKVITHLPSGNFITICTFVDDKQLVFDRTLTNVLRIVYSIPMIVLICIFMYGIFGFSYYGIFDYIGVAFCVILTIPCLYGLTYIIINPNRTIIFNRLEGTVTLPAYKWKWLNKETVTQPFEKTRFSGVRYDIYVGILGTLDRFAFLSSLTGRQWEDFSALVWYMDKNRPLPLGKVFDPYREKDYNRRKAEKFPKPLYPSLINTSGWAEWKGAKKK